METVSHLWNVNDFVTKLKCPQVTELQTFYINLGSEVLLPQQNFGPSVMCSYCGSLWKTIDHRIRLSRAKKASRSIRKLKKQNCTSRKLPRVRASLIRKCTQNEMNKLVITCSVCSRNTRIPLTKPKRITLPKSENLQTPQNTAKKKKKKFKDKTVGLNISGCSLPQETAKKKKPIKSKVQTVKAFTPTPKLKQAKLDKLKNILNNSVTPVKKNSLKRFLTELY